MTAAWLVENPPPGPARRRLFCLPFAGAGAAVYEPWRRALPSTLVSAVRLPGRENRFREPPLTDADAVVDELAPVVAARVAADGGLPWAVFGYSLGGLLAYDLVAELAQTGGPVPGVLIIGGAEPPHVPRHLPDMSWLPHDDFVASLHRLGGTAPEVLASPELLELLLPMVRADFRIVESHPVRTGPRLPCPIVTYRGTEDHEVRPAAVQRWSELTASGVTHRELAGDHFVITQAATNVTDQVAADLDGFLGA